VGCFLLIFTRKVSPEDLWGGKRLKHVAEKIELQDSLLTKVSILGIMIRDLRFDEN